MDREMDVLNQECSVSYNGAKEELYNGIKSEQKSEVRE